ncbi:hypothetical protein V6N13_002664 [Hibiscus sabdariffa]
MIHVGLIVDTQSWVGKIVDSCIFMAISDFYGRHSHYRTKLVLHTRDSEGDPLLVLSQENSAAVKILAELGSRVQIPIISLFAAGPVLSFSDYPCLIQIGKDEFSRAKGIATIVEAFGGLGQHIAFSASFTDEEIIQQLKMLMDLRMTVYVMHTSPILASRLFSNAKQLGMIIQGYAWITTDMITNFINSMDPSVNESMRGMVGFKPHIPASKELRNLVIRWRSRNLKEEQNLQEMKLNVYGIWTYDMIQALATAAESIMARHPDFMRQEIRLNMNFTTIRSSQSGLVFIDEILQSKFKGVSRGFQLTSGRLIPKEFEIVNVFKGERILGYRNPENGITSIMQEENHTR